MKHIFIKASLLVFAALTFSACSGDDDNDPESSGINIPEIDDECCNEEETFLAYTFLTNGFVKEIESLREQVDGKYELRVYSAAGKLHVGYNDLYFSLTKLSNGGYVRDFDITDITPLMTMTGGMSMQHSMPIGPNAVVHDQTFPAVRRAWVSFLMSSGDNGYWDLAYTLEKEGSKWRKEDTRIVVEPLAEPRVWLKSFKVGDNTFYLSLANATDFRTGNNIIKAYVSKVGTDRKQPYLLASERFTIDIYPTMPDMGNHSSPGNEALTLQPDGSYEGRLNLSMTGTWDIHLHVKDAEGNSVAGEEGLSELFWTVVI